MKKKIDWIKIRKEYEKGGVTTKQLAEKYGISPLTVRNRCTKEKWRGGRDEVEQKFDAALTKHIENKALTLAEKAAQIHEKHLEESDRMDEMLEEAWALRNSGDMDGVRKLISSWAEKVKVQRVIVGMEQQVPTRFNVGLNFTVVEVPGPDDAPVIDVPAEPEAGNEP